ncbi:hypothetical protein OAA06_00005 [bacterium]|nr:hypothetical protein [bacterium]
MIKNLSLGLIVLLVLVSGCQYFGGEQNTSGNTTSAKNDSVKVEKRYFDNDPNSSIEWKISQRLMPNGKYVRHGMSVRFTKSGKVEETINYANDLKEGERIKFHTNGKKYKVQNYVANKLEGDCKRLGRDGHVEAEYTYKAGLLGTGLVRYTNLGKVRPEPKLVIHQTNKIKEKGMYILSVSLVGDDALKDIRKVEFFDGDLAEGKYFHKNLKLIRSTGAHQGVINIVVEKGYIYEKTHNIVAKATTKDGLSYIIQKKVSVAVRGI